MSTVSNHSFIINTVINDLLDPEKSLVGPLIKLQYFGKLTKNDELVQYTLKELNGYAATDILPQNRKLGALLFIDFRAGYNEHPHKQLPINGFDEETQKMFKYIPVFNSVKSLESSISQLNKHTGTQIQLPLPVQLLSRIEPEARKAYYSDIKIYVTAARLVANRAKLVEITDTIRTNLLSFAMEIAENFGYEIEITDYNKAQETNNQKIIHFMTTNNINTTGDGNVINTGDSAKIEAKINITKGSKEKLVFYLESQGLDRQDVDDLIEVIDVDEPNYEAKTPGPKVTAWILKMLAKTADSSWQIGIGAAGSLLAEAIGKYYGFS